MLSRLIRPRSTSEFASASIEVGELIWLCRLSFMCRSDFGAQEGDFELVVCEMAEEEKEGKGGNRGWWRSLVEVVRGWMGSVSGWWRGDEAMRLP